MTLIKIDRNGTKYYSSNKCKKCGGEGVIYYYKHVESGVCFMCHGTGMITSYTIKEYTPEYLSKLAERRHQKMLKAAPEKNAKFLKQNGFNEDGFSWIVCGNTYKIKEELKSAGAKFNDFLGWHFNFENKDFDCIKLDVKEVSFVNELGLICFDGVADIVDRKKREFVKEHSTLEFIGEVGEVIEKKLKLEKINSYSTNYSYRGETVYVYKFTDENKNVFVWKTSSFQTLEEDLTYTVKGKIKNHNEYKGEKQNELTRCKITK